MGLSLWVRFLIKPERLLVIESEWSGKGLREPLLALNRTLSDVVIVKQAFADCICQKLQRVGNPNLQPQICLRSRV